MLARGMLLLFMCTGINTSKTIATRKGKQESERERERERKQESTHTHNTPHFYSFMLFPLHY
jgi:hypothetical protein